MDESDWRSDLQPHARKVAIQQIMDAVKLCNNLYDEDGMQELEKCSQSFEKKTFAGATSQSDYLQKINSKEASMKRKMQEETYHKIVMMKGMYLTDLKEMYQKIVDKIQQLSLSSSLTPLDSNQSQVYEKLQMFKAMLELLIAFLQISESNVSPTTSQKLPSYERQIINFINTKRPKGSQIRYNHTSSGASSGNIAAP